MICVPAQHAIADEAIAIAAHHPDFVDSLGEIDDGDQHVLRGIRAAHDLQQPHHVGGREEMHSDDIAGPRGRLGDLVDRQVRGIRSENCALFDGFVKLREHVFLDGHGLEYRFDDQVRVAQIVVGQRRL